MILLYALVPYEGSLELLIEKRLFNRRRQKCGALPRPQIRRSIIKIKKGSK
jgi:hypothetical protein